MQVRSTGNKSAACHKLPHFGEAQPLSIVALPEARKCTIGVVRHCLCHASRRQTAPDEFGEARLRAHAQKRGAQLQDVQRWRAFLISLLEPLQSPALIAKTAVNHGEVERGDVTELGSLPQVVEQLESFSSLSQPSICESQLRSRPRTPSRGC